MATSQVSSVHLTSTDDPSVMLNATDQENLSSTSPLWIAAQVLNNLLMVLVLWLTIAFFAYGCKTGKWKRRKKHDFSGGKVLNVAVASTLLVLPRLVVTQVVIFVGYRNTPKENRRCELLMDFSIILYYVALVPVYTYLWMRQKALYAQPSIKCLRTKLVKVLSWGSYAFLLLSGLGTVVLFILPTAYAGSTEGCVLREEEEDNLLPFYIMLAVQVVGQFVLLGLFIYPLKVHSNVQATLLTMRQDSCPSTVDTSIKQTDDSGSPKKRNPRTSHELALPPSYECDLTPRESKGASNAPANQQIERVFRSKSDTSLASKRTVQRTPLRQSLGAVRRQLSMSVGKAFRSDSKTPSYCAGKRGNRVLRVIKRSVACAALCMASDLFAMATVAFFLNKDTPKSITNTIYDVGLFINVLSIIVSFETYKGIVMSPCAKREGKQKGKKLNPVADSGSQSVDQLSEPRDVRNG